MIQGKMYENFALCATIDSQTVSDTAVTSDVIDMSKWHKIMAVFMLGNMAAETIDCAIYTCDSGGTNGAAFMSATQLAAHATNNDNHQIIIEVDGDQLAEGGTNADRYVMARMITGGSTGGPASCAVFGIPKNGPGTNDDLSTISEIVTDAD